MTSSVRHASSTLDTDNQCFVFVGELRTKPVGVFFFFFYGEFRGIQRAPHIENGS